MDRKICERVFVIRTFLSSFLLPYVCIRNAQPLHSQHEFGERRAVARRERPFQIEKALHKPYTTGCDSQHMQGLKGFQNVFRGI